MLRDMADVNKAAGKEAETSGLGQETQIFRFYENKMKWQTLEGPDGGLLTSSQAPVK